MEFSAKAISTRSNYHLAGIIPVSSKTTGFDVPYPDVLLPIAQDYTMIEAAVVECAFAGCDTIWIVCNDDISPLMRYRIGDFIQDPVYFYNNFGSNPTHNRIRIPIYWVPVHPKDRDKRDCLSWHIIQGALSSLKVSTMISEWVKPTKYYVSFPHGIFDPRILRGHRKKIRTDKNFYITYQGKTVQDNYYTSFTFGREEFIRYRRNIRQGTGKYSSEDLSPENLPRKFLPIEERWSARFFQLKDVFTDLDLDKATLLEPEQFNNLNSWDLYREYMCTDLAKDTTRPSRNLFSYREFNSVARDRE